MIEDGLAAYIQAIPTVAEYSQGIYWNIAPQRVPAPFIILTQVAGNETYAHDGPDGLGTIRIQVDVYASTAALAKKIRLSIIRALNGQSFMLSTGDKIAVCEHISTIDRVETEIFTTDARFRAMTDFTLQYIIQ